MLRQNGCHFGDIFKLNFLEKKFDVFYSNFTEVGSWGSSWLYATPHEQVCLMGCCYISGSALVMIMTWHFSGDKPLFETVIAHFTVINAGNYQKSNLSQLTEHSLVNTFVSGQWSIKWCFLIGQWTVSQAVMWRWKYRWAAYKSFDEISKFNSNFGSWWPNCSKFYTNMQCDLPEAYAKFK